MVDVSVVIPVFNEEETVREVVTQVEEVLRKNKFDGEVVVVDDGSTDDSRSILYKLTKAYSNLKVVSHRVNLGKSEALMTGFRESGGEIVLFLDADSQYDTVNIPLFLKKIDEGFDVVNGWRVERKDSLSRVLASRVYNTLTNMILGPKLHDHNCGMKAFRKKVVEDVLLRTGQHRYITSIAKRLGYKVCEVKITHYPREYGKSKFSSPLRLYSGVIDMLALRFQMDYSSHPLLVFASIGGVLWFFGILLGLYLLSLWLTRLPGEEPLKNHLPLVLFTVSIVLVGALFFVFGLLADMISALKKDVEALKERLNK